MQCDLCKNHVDLWEYDNWMGLPAHKSCADAMRAEAAAVLAEAEALILAEADPRKHRVAARRRHPSSRPIPS